MCHLSLAFIVVCPIPGPPSSWRWQANTTKQTELIPHRAPSHAESLCRVNEVCIVVVFLCTRISARLKNSCIVARVCILVVCERQQHIWKVEASANAQCASVSVKQSRSRVPIPVSVRDWVSVYVVIRSAPKVAKIVSRTLISQLLVIVDKKSIKKYGKPSKTARGRRAGCGRRAVFYWFRLIISRDYPKSLN